MAPVSSPKTDEVTALLSCFTVLPLDVFARLLLKRDSCICCSQAEVCKPSQLMTFPQNTLRSQNAVVIRHPIVQLLTRNRSVKTMRRL